mgnify:CR=1 FL=1
MIDCAALPSLANLFKIYGDYTSYSYLADGSGAQSWHTVYWQLYEEYRGEITPEKIEQLLAVYQPLAQATADMTASTATDDPNTMTGNLYSDRIEQIGKAERHKKRQNGTLAELLDKFIPYQTYHGVPPCNSTRTHLPG